ncbi:uncharacterized protein LOC129004741 [Macrosteles quadrilineatus]|uniref:uncharacterized protein LOC129004741 n=1 Tax=Macrosteles quadrilineatus TaxID=74068 RepID=UPI0023E10634|nr:uncharacterized protein LOC129004741 [Macrosteles quadrilineatus]
MIVVKDGPSHEREKRLRVNGEPERVEYAITLIYELMAQNEIQEANRRILRSTPNLDISYFEKLPPLKRTSRKQKKDDQIENDACDGPSKKTAFQFSKQTTIELMVPGPKVGLIIGKGGETIHRLQEVWSKIVSY